MTEVEAEIMGILIREDENTAAQVTKIAAIVERSKARAGLDTAALICRTLKHQMNQEAIAEGVWEWYTKEHGYDERRF